MCKFVCVCAFGNSYQHIYYTMYGNKHQLCYFFHRLSLISLVAAFVTILSGCVNDDDPDVRSLGAGDRCPDFAVLMNDGTTVSTESLRGRRTMIVFFETSCSDCRQELPVIEEVYRQTAGREDVSVICISRAQDQASVADYWEAHGLTLPYSAQSTAYVYHLFASSIIPRIYIIDGNLTITAAYSDDPMPDAPTLLRELL